MILLSSLSQSYDHIITNMLYSKKTLILEVMSTLLYNKIRKRSNQEEQTGSSLVARKEKEKERKVRTRQKYVTFVTEKVIERMTTSIDKSN